MLKPYRCSHCGQRIVMLETVTSSFLPVEIPEGEITIEEKEYDKEKHTSHLKNCPKLAAEWEWKKKKLIKEKQAELLMGSSDLLG